MRNTIALTCLVLTTVFSHARGCMAGDVVFSDIAPIVNTRCVMCHSEDNASAGLRLDNLDGMLRGSSNGPVLVAGQPQNSELIRRIRGLSLPRMPLTGPPFLTEEEMTLIEDWVASGLKTGNTVQVSRPKTPNRLISPPGVPTFGDVMPILGARCVKCHAEQGLMGPAPEGFVLTSYQEALSQTERVRIVPGYPQASELVRRIKGLSVPRMPFDGPPFLQEQEITLIDSWIAQGARDAENVPAAYPLGARIRVEGRLLKGWILEDDLTVSISASTRRDKNPGPGDYVEVRGRLGDKGVIIAERIRRR